MSSETTVRRPASMRDVARLAGVSHQTVSRVLNNSPSIREETRARVLDAMGRLQYRPNRAARMLVTSRSRALGILTSDRMHYGPSSSIVAIEAAARSAGYSVVTANLPSTDPAAITAALDHLLDQAVEGLVVIAPQARVSTAITSLAIQVPHVTLQSAGADDAHSLSVDQIAGARLATRHLLELGHRRIRHIAGPPDWREAEGRMRGFLAEMSEWGALPGDIPVGDWTADSGYRAGLALFAGDGATAVFAGNDQMALGILHAARDSGLDCPRDVSVVGFDDMPEARHFSPPLTTVRQDFAELGRRCVTLLLGALEDGRGYSGTIAPELVVRGSTGPVRI